MPVVGATQSRIMFQVMNWATSARRGLNSAVSLNAGGSTQAGTAAMRGGMPTARNASWATCLQVSTSGPPMSQVPAVPSSIRSTT